MIFLVLVCRKYIVWSKRNVPIFLESILRVNWCMHNVPYPIHRLSVDDFFVSVLREQSKKIFVSSAHKKLCKFLCHWVQVTSNQSCYQQDSILANEHGKSEKLAEKSPHVKKTSGTYLFREVLLTLTLLKRDAGKKKPLLKDNWNRTFC